MNNATGVLMALGFLALMGWVNYRDPYLAAMAGALGLLAALVAILHDSRKENQ